MAASSLVVESIDVTESGVKLIGWVAAAAVATAVLIMPQPVDPWEMPSLVLERSAVSDAIRFDQALAGEAPDGAEAQALRSLFLDHGRAEAHPPYEVRDYDRRQADIHRARKALVAADGRAAFEALRARAVEDFISTYFDARGEPRNEDEVAMFGGFPEIARRYRLVDDGVVIAPDLTVRALYKARWNVIHRQASTEGFSRIELQAYWGWLALHGRGRPLGQREDALVAFRNAGGSGTEEAAALFDLLSGRPDRAATSLQHLYAARGELRLRNLGLGALHAALLQAEGP